MYLVLVLLSLKSSTQDCLHSFNFLLTSIRLLSTSTILSAKSIYYEISSYIFFATSSIIKEKKR
uniref:Uncharacterized protein n=1 Tax=Arundo donax TaxID=35708 RepID=A0A0A9DWT3_ARUDO